MRELRAVAESPYTGGVVSALRGVDALTLSELASVTSLSRPTVAETISLLIADQLVDRLPPVTGQRVGRPAARYRFRRDGGVVVAVVIDDERLDILIAGLDGAERGIARFPVSASGPRGRVDEVIATIVKATQRFAPGAPIFAIGVGVPGMVDDRGLIRRAPAIPDLDGVHLGDELRDAFGCELRIGNTAHLAAVAEHRLGAAVGTDTYLYIWAAPRVTSALFVGGRLHAGSSGAAGSVGEVDSLGWRNAASHEPSPATFAAAAQGDRTALAGVGEYAEALAPGTAMLALAVDPELIVVGYLEAPGAEVLAPLLAAAIARHAHVIEPPVVMSPLGHRVALLGPLTAATEFLEREVLGLA